MLSVLAGGVPVLVDPGFALADDERVFVAIRQIEASGQQLHFVLLVAVGDERLKRPLGGDRGGPAPLVSPGLALEIDFGGGRVGRLRGGMHGSYSAGIPVWTGPGTGGEKMMSVAARVALPDDFDSVVFRLSWPQAGVSGAAISVPGELVKRAAREAVDIASVAGVRAL